MKINFCLFAVCWFALVGTNHAQEGLDLESVSIFKNKTAFFVKEGKVKTKDKSWVILGDTIPRALNGTFWLSSPNQGFELVKAYHKEIEKTKKAAASKFSALLALNDGKEVTLVMKDTSHTGTIIFMQPEAEEEKPDVPNLQSMLFGLKTQAGKTLVFTQNQINQDLQRMEFAKSPTFIYDFKQKTKKPALQIDFKSDKAEQPLNMMYLSRGLAWKPDYLIELVEDEKAKLTLRATVVNNAEDIETDKLNLVAGVPNFKYATSISELINFLPIPQPIAARHNTFSNVAVPNRAEASYSNDFASGPSGNTTFNPNNSNFDNASAMEDLYFYTLKNIILKKGERAFFDIFNIEIPVEHIYESVLNANNVSYSLDYNFLQKRNPVIHTLKLYNKSNFTWTAAPALVIKNDKDQNAPISQDKLNYTSQNNDISVKLTEAPDVNVSFKENEVKREANKKSVKSGKYTYYHDLVTVETEVTITNFKKKDIRLDLKRLITGELIDSNTKWLKSPRVQYGYTINKKTDVCWEMKLKAGEKKVIKYSFEYYTSRHR